MEGRADADEEAGGGGGVRRSEASRALARAARERRHVAAVEAGQLRRRYRLGLLGGWAILTTLVTGGLLMARGTVLAAEAFFIATTVAVVALPILGRGALPHWLLQRQLRAGDRDAALATGHLSPSLASLVENTRLLRLAVEVAEPADDDASRAIWAWIRQVQGLAPLDRAVLEQLGLSATGDEAALLGDAESGAAAYQRRLEELGRAEGPEEDAIARARAEKRRMDVIAEQLEGFEAALLRYDPGPYR